jgi:hypothetical protein
MKVMAGGFRRVKPGDPHYQTFKKEGVFPAALRWALRNANIDDDSVDHRSRSVGRELRLHGKAFQRAMRAAGRAA